MKPTSAIVDVSAVTRPLRAPRVTAVAGMALIDRAKRRGVDALCRSVGLRNGPNCRCPAADSVRAPFFDRPVARRAARATAAAGTPSGTVNAAAIVVGGIDPDASPRPINAPTAALCHAAGSRVGTVTMECTID